MLVKKKLKVGDVININSHLIGGLRVRGKVHFLFSNAFYLKRKKICLNFCLLPTDSFNVIGVLDKNSEISGKQIYKDLSFEKKIEKVFKSQFGNHNISICFSEHGLQGENFIHLETSELLKAWFISNIKNVKGFDKNYFDEKLKSIARFKLLMKDAGITVKSPDYSMTVKSKHGSILGYRNLSLLLSVNGWSILKNKRKDIDYAFSKQFSEFTASLYFSKHRSILTYQGYKLDSKRNDNSSVEFSKFKSNYKALTFSDITKLKSGQKVQLYVYLFSKMKQKKFWFTFEKIVPDKTIQKNTKNYLIKGKSLYLENLPMSFDSKSKTIRIVQSSDISPVYWLPIITKPKQGVHKIVRPSPSDSATKFKAGTTKRGGDGNLWRVTKTKTGVKRWSKA